MTFEWYWLTMVFVYFLVRQYFAKKLAMIKDLPVTEYHRNCVYKIICKDPAAECIKQTSRLLKDQCPNTREKKKPEPTDKAALIRLERD